MKAAINLNRYRKDKARAEKKARADQNAVTFGRTKADKEAAKLSQMKQRRNLDGHEIDK